LPFRIKYITTLQNGKTLVASDKEIFKPVSNNGQAYVFIPVVLNSDRIISNITAIYLDNRDYLYISENSENLLIFKETPDGFVFQKK
jgi:hypothetical protein